MQVGKSTRSLVAALALAALALPASTAVATQSPESGDGIHVVDGRIYEADGTELVLRGINHAHTWYTGNTQSFADIADTGANSVRTVLSNGVKWIKNDTADVQNVVDLAKDNNLISILEVHDTTGYGDVYADPPRSTLDQAADYWISIKDALIGQEDYVMVNIGNEPYGNDATINAGYAAATKAAIVKMRNAGIKNTIVVDAPAWGQDWQNIMRDTAGDIYSADPTGNTVFSIHMYQVYSTPAAVTAYLESFVSRDLPIIVGEFGDAHQGENVAWETILSESERLDLGWLAWSWSGNTDPYLDLVLNFDPAQVSPWGAKIIDGANGLKATSRIASIFDEDNGSGTTDGGTTDGGTTDGGTTDGGTTDGGTTDGGTTDGGTTDGTPAPTCSASYTTYGNWGSGFQGGIEVTSNAPVTNWKLTFNLGGASIANGWGGQVTGSSSSYTVNSESWNGTLNVGQKAQFGFIGTGSAPTNVAVTCN